MGAGMPYQGNNAVDSMSRGLDSLSLNSAPPPSSSSAAMSASSSTNPAAIDPSFPHLRDKAWFYGAITRAECDNLLNQYGQDGDFLVRSSETNVSCSLLKKKTGIIA